MIGQTRLVNKLNNLSIDKFPKSLILCGEYGCGKHMFCKLISDKFNDWEFVYVDYKLNYDFVENCYLSIIPTFYVINADNISEKEQNVILKIFEEPPNNINIILLSSSSTLLLPTILNRAVVWEFDLYSKETLKSFNNEMSDSVLDLVSTPGQLLELTNIKLEDMLKLANLIIDKIDRASVSNILSLSNKFNLTKDDVEKFNILVFVRLLRKTFLLKIKSENVNDVKYFKGFKLTNQLYNDLLVNRYNKKYLFENYLLSLKDKLK